MDQDYPINGLLTITTSDTKHKGELELGDMANGRARYIYLNTSRALHGADGIIVTER